jgi:Cyclic nucleotide-binding domain/Major Facilitator Superfamily
MLRSVANSASALRRVFANPDIRRAELAWMTAYAAEWAWLVALFVYAFTVGGVGAVGLVGLGRTLPAAVLAPALSSVADRAPRHRVLLAVHLGRAAGIGLAAIAVFADWPVVLVFAIPPLEGLLAVLHRPTHMALMPSLARAPAELVAANAASATLEAVGTFIGPVIGAALLATGMPVLTFVLPAIGFSLAAVTVAGIRPAQQLRSAPASVGIAATLLAGGRALVDHPHAALLLGLFGAQITVRGILNVLLVVAAVELLALGTEGVGILTAAMGAGGFVGALLTMSMVDQRRMAPSFLAGLILWGTPILIIGVVPLALVGLLGLAVLGAGNAILDVAGFTLLQRSVPNAVRGRVFGLLEAIVMFGLAIGSAVAPVLVATLGPRGALIATGAILPAAALLSARSVLRVDEVAVIPERELALLRGVPMFGLLPLTVLEQVAADARPRSIPAGTRIIGEGEVGGSFYVLAEGEVEATVRGRVVRRLHPGESFGEIALLRDVPRTASVTTRTDVEALVLDREAFVSAVTGDRSSLTAAERVIEERLASG